MNDWPPTPFLESPGALEGLKTRPPLIPSFFLSFSAQREKELHLLNATTLTGITTGGGDSQLRDGGGCMECQRGQMIREQLGVKELIVGSFTYIYNCCAVLKARGA